MSTTEVRPESTKVATTTYRAAVVHDFAKPLRVEHVQQHPPAPARSGCGSRLPACATPTSMPHMAIGP
jgi:hypothetical protein